MRILGLSFFYHDAAACLLIDGVPVAMAEEERFSRKKHDSGFPSLATDFVLKKANLKASDVDWVVFYEKPFIKFERIIKTALKTFPLAPGVFRESIKHLFLDKLWIRYLIASELCVSPQKVLFSNHHLSHAASAFFCSPYDEAAILTVDGVGEWATTALSIGEGNKIRILKEVHFPHSLGLLYSVFTAFLGFEVNEGEYKVMGMAPYGIPRYVDKVKKLITLTDDSSFRLNLDYFKFQRSLSETFSNKFVELFGEPRNKNSQLQEFYADIAASIQAVLEEHLVALANHLYKLTGIDTLCLAGGVALNSVANWKIRQKTPFRQIYIQPASGDSGGALGAALALYHIAFNKKRGFVMGHAYWGAEYSNEEIEKSFQERKLSYKFVSGEDELIDIVSDNITKGKVIGWFQGPFEWGPRALGNRSILADPRRAEMKDIVNTKIKFREPYRPFAPSVLAEHAGGFFEIPDLKSHYPARFMLYVVPVKKDKQGIVPAITHVDGSARPQLVFRETSPRYWKLIDRFRQKTSVPMLLNTSFNLRGEPIVNTPENAINTFLKSEMDMLVLEDFIVYKNGSIIRQAHDAEQGRSISSP
ncbi:MAG: carbamoyltransferase [Parcubacteria group bacterium Gr01-1014_2]|nr:MAG: carbamoyltransferase [Parcubacteria group bacterium Gr01-1014_2]